MKYRTSLFVFVCALSMIPAFSSGVFAWGKIGHAAVADVAQALLTPRALAKAKKLLAIEHLHNLSDVSSWADEIKSEHLPGSPSHTVRLALDGSPPGPHPCPGGFCADEAILKYKADLANVSLPKHQREIALKYLVHLVGDLHQPLHATQPSGSEVYVLYNGKKEALHAVWDTGIIKKHGGTHEQIASGLLQLDTRARQGTPMEWAIEGRDIAVREIYSEIPPFGKSIIPLPFDYTTRKWPIIESRLATAGVRLANILNEALDP